MTLTKRTWRLALVCMLGMLSRAGAAPVQPIIIIQGPEASATDGVATTAPHASPAKPPRGAIIVAQPAQDSGTTFIAAHAPSELAAPLPNLQLNITGMGDIPLRNAAIELIDRHGKTALSTLVCADVFLTRMPPGTYHLNVGFDRFWVTQNVTVTDQKIHVYRVAFPIKADAGSGPPREPSPTPTQLHELLDTMHLVAHESEQRCS